VFYIIEEEHKLENLERLMKLGAYVDVVSSNDEFHPKLTSTVAVYIRLVNSHHGYIIPINHEEGLNVSKDRIYGMLNNTPKLYTKDKKELLYHFNIQGAIDISLLYSMVNYNRLEISNSNSTYNWYYTKHKHRPNVNQLIPISKLYEKCEETYKQVKKVIDIDIPSGFEFYNNLATNVFYLLEQPGIGIYNKPFELAFTPKDPIYNIDGSTVYTSYNLYNATSRPTNAFNSVNFAAIPKTEEHRKCFKPQNDTFVEFDFDGYHLRLLCEQIGYKLSDESAHKQLAKHYFGTEDISEEQYLEAKQINFQAIYGKIPHKHKNLKIFKLIQEFIDNMWSVYEEAGEVCNPVSGKPFTKKLGEMHPAKLMNYMMQSLETSRNILILKDVLRFLKDKKTTVVLFTYDSLLFDFDKADGKQVLIQLEEILNQGGKYPVKYKTGNNLLL
tara:strand:+ start:5855 stop:7180 length:1326 start_codon:yes stop_codon:yes gene_type:complete